MLVEELNPLQRLLEAQKRTSGGGSDGVFALEAGGGGGSGSGGGGSKHDGEYWLVLMLLMLLMLVLMRVGVIVEAV